MASAAEARGGSVPEPGYYGVGPDETDLRAVNPWPALDKVRDEVPVHPTPEGFWRIYRYEDIVHVLRELPCGVRKADGRLPEMYGDAPGSFMLQRDPPDHTRLRKLVSKAFTPRATESWRPRARAIADELLGEAVERGRMDAVADLALPLPSKVICEMLGVPAEDRERFTRWTAEATHRLSGSLAPPEIQERSAASALELAGYFNALIEERTKKPGDDLLSAMIRARDEEDALTPDELLTQAIGLLIAGFETTIGQIALGLRTLILHPAELERLRGDASLAATCAEECLRFDAPIGLTTRVLHEDAVVRGVPIPKDAMLWLYTSAANRDPEVFEDPGRFDIGRNPNPHLTFGGGAHFCLGAHLARMEVQEAFLAVVRHAQDLELETPDEIEWGLSLFRVPGTLPIRLRPRGAA